ncbi:MAG TPA: hypothetical protein VF173_29870 [Thermoanaerobaculia bacterium]|nr:hypothetical protein [Thermoanaerobaculia bacterium]
MPVRSFPGEMSLDAILVGGESRRVEQLVVPVRQDVDHRLLESPPRVLLDVGRPQVCFVEKGDRLKVEHLL